MARLATAAQRPGPGTGRQVENRGPNQSGSGLSSVVARYFWTPDARPLSPPRQIAAPPSVRRRMPRRRPISGAAKKSILKAKRAARRQQAAHGHDDDDDADAEQAPPATTALGRESPVPAAADRCASRCLCTDSRPGD